MSSNQQNESIARELAQVRRQLVQIKLILAGILVLAIGALVGPGPVLKMVWIGVIGLAAIYAGLWVFERLVKRRVGHDWSEARLASMAEELESSDDGDRD